MTPFYIYSIAYSFPILTFFLLLCYIVGWFLHNKFFSWVSLPKTFQRLFAYISLGLFAILTLYALVVTQGKSIHFLFLLLGMVFSYELYQEKKNWQTKNKVAALHKWNSMMKVPILLPILVVILLQLVWASVLLSQDGQIVVPDKDYAYYAKLCSGMYEYRVENINHIINELTPAVRKPDFYHYFELWLNILFTQASGGYYLSNFFFLTFPFLSVLCYIGFLGLWEVFDKKVSLQYAMLSIIFFHISGIILGFLYTQIPLLEPMITAQLSVTDRIGDYNLTMMNAIGGHYKMLTYYWAGLMFLLLFLNQQHRLALIGLLTLPVMAFTAFPAIIGGTLLFLLINSYGKWQPTHYRLFLYPLGIAFFMFLFYYMTSTSGGHVYMKNTNSFDLYSKTIYWFSALTFFARNYPFIVLLYLPYLAVLVFFKVKLDKIGSLQVKYRHLCILIFCISFVGACCQFLLYYDINAMQLNLNVTITLCNLLLVLVIIQQVAEKGYFAKVSIGLLIVASLSSLKQLRTDYTYIKNNQANFFKHGIPYREKIKTAQQQYKLKKGICLKVESYYASSPFYKSTFTYSSGEYFWLFSNVTHTIPIDEMTIALSAEPLMAQREQRVIQKGAFYQYVEQQKKEGKFSSVEQSQQDFVKQYNLQYAIIDADRETPKWILEKAQTSIVDEKTGEKFIVFKL
jgi:hypothetical protein